MVIKENMDHMKINSVKKGEKFVFSLIFVPLFILLYSPFCWGYSSFEGIIQEETLTVPKPLLTIISVDMDNVPLEEALSIIAEKSNIMLNYNRSRLPVHKRITVKMSNVPALKVLLKVLSETGAELRINKGGHIIISPQRKKISPRGSIYGKVEESSSNRIIPGTVVQILNTKSSTSTDQNGEYRLYDIPTGNYTLRFEMDGFKTLDKTDVIIRSDRITYVNAQLDILLFNIQESVEVIGSNFQLD
jgi:hypothetical protein